MAKLMAGLVCAILLFVSVLTIQAAGVEYIVGDSEGWTAGQDYNAWAEGKEFHRGDVLVFSYAEGYGVDEVTAEKLEECDNTAAIFSDHSGETYIPLSTAGDHYFIGGPFRMCPDGMNMTITVH
ncbi:hypothetical protein Droror1_Dr00018547 [Drosera rotundifolia]